jgi:hypothetical protein
MKAQIETQELTKIQILTSDVFDVASEPHISIDFTKDGQQFFVEIAAQDALKFLQKAGRYAYERFVSHADGELFVIELQGEDDREVRVKIETRLESLSKKDLDAIVRKAMVCPDYRDSIEELSLPF